MSKKINFMPYFLMFIVLALSHGMLLINDGLYWDGWLSLGMMENNDMAEIRAQYSEMGLPALYYISLLFFKLEIYPYYKAIAFLSIYLISIILFKINQKLNFLTHFEAIIVSLIAISFPAYQMTVEYSTLNYIFLPLLFYFAVYILILSQDDVNIVRRRLLYSCALILLLISFNFNSLLTYYFPIIFIILFYQFKKENIRSQNYFLFTLKNNWLLFVIPFMYWAWRRFYCPVYGEYLNYHKFILDPIFIYDSLIIFIKVSFFGQIFRSLMLAFDHYLLLTVNLFITFILYNYLYTKYSHAETIKASWVNKTSPLLILSFGVVLLVSAIFPYAVTGYRPDYSGIGSRVAALVAVPSSIIIISIFAYFGKSFPQLNYKSMIIFKRRQLLIVSILIFSFILSCNSFYISWQARAVKDNATISILKNRFDLTPYSIYIIDDQYPSGPIPQYDYYEYSSMFKKIWGGESRIGIPLNKYIKNKETINFSEFSLGHRYNLKDFNQDGSQIFIKIESNSAHKNDFMIVFYYYYNKFKYKIKGLDFNIYLRNLVVISAYENYYDLKDNKLLNHKM